MTTTSGVSLALLALAACATPREKVPGNSNTAVSASPVRIDSIRPASVELLGPGLAELKVYGAGFVADSNQVMLDNMSIATVKSSDGAYMRLVLTRTLPSSGGPPMTIMGGDHSLQVKNARGSSNTVQLKVE